jgi:hypothetical protein
MCDGRNKAGKTHLAPKDRLVGYNRGKWTSTEEKKLIVAVHEVGRGANDIEEIAWAQVAKLVKTRNTTQCRKKWAETLKRSEDSRKEAAEQKSTNFALLKNLNRVMTPAPSTIAPFAISSLTPLQDHHQPQHVVVNRQFHPHVKQHQTEELILFEGVDDQTFANLQLSYVHTQ